MRRLYESLVQPNEVDTLGHVNVRFYMQRVQLANQALMRDLGFDLEGAAAQGRKFIQTDTYCRYHREQFPGAHLAVQGGVLQVGESGVRVFHEVLNDQKNEPAATFIIEYALIEAASRAAVPLPTDVVTHAALAMVSLPMHGQPRSIDLSPPRLDLSYADVLARVGEAGADDPMGGRGERVVDAEDCDAFGYLHDDQDMAFSARRIAQLPPGKTFGPPVFTTDEGHRFGWAWLETRNIRIAQPRAGDVLQSIGAEIGLQSKTRHSRRWTFNKASGALASINDTVGIALDLDARRPITIPANIRQTLEASHTPELLSDEKGRRLMIEQHVAIATKDGAMNTFTVHPERGGPHPVVLFFMDAPGIREELRDMSRRLACAGYYVMLPNLYYRAGVEEVGPLNSETGVDRMRTLMQSIDIPMIMADADALLAFADTQPAASQGAAATVGYCMSGTYAINAAANHPDRIKAAASYYGVRLVTDRNDSPHLSARKATGEIYVAAAEIDPFAPLEEINALAKDLAANGVNAEVEIYPAVHHGFAFPERGAFNKDAAERHWERLYALLRRNL